MQSAGMQIKQDGGTEDSGRYEALLAAAGLLGALAAFSCCILPLALFGLGVSGAWIGNFTQLAPYHSFFVAAALACIAAGAWLARRASGSSCVAGGSCALPLPSRLIKAALIVAALLVVAAIFFDVFAPLLLS
jgi:mercuric ion transport protein